MCKATSSASDPIVDPTRTQYMRFCHYVKFTLEFSHHSPDIPVLEVAVCFCRPNNPGTIALAPDFKKTDIDTGEKFVIIADSVVVIAVSVVDFLRLVSSLYLLRWHCLVVDFLGLCCSTLVVYWHSSFYLLAS